MGIKRKRRRMEHMPLEQPDGDEERACAQFFLNWYNERHGTSYKLKRTKDVFPDLFGQKGRGGDNNWDFVAQQREDDPRWMAIEVKGLRFPPLLRNGSQWGDFFSHIKNSVASKVSGTFVLDNLPLPPGNASERKKAAEEIAYLVVETAQNLSVGETSEVQGAYRVRISKLSDTGGSVHGIGRVPFYPADPIEDEETERMAKKAVEQLHVAQDKGAVTRILLFCAHAPRYDLDNFKESLRQRQGHLMDVVDEAFLVDVEQAFPLQLWP